MELAELLKDEKNKEEIKRAIKEDRILFLKKGDREIGFFTYDPHKDGVYIGNMWIDEEYRKTNNLLFLRKYFRDMFKKGNWKNRKKGRLVWVS